MNLFLVIIPVVLVMSSILIYRFVGRREFFRFDLIQFFYAFIIMPIMFVWGKILIFTLIRSTLTSVFSGLNYFIIDSIYGIIFLYIFGFEMLHSLTKSVSLKVLQDPLHDIFGHLEYFHLWLTHLVCFTGSLLLLMIFSLSNLFFPLDLHLSRYAFDLFLVGSLLFGGLSFVGIWLSDPHQGGKYRFMRIMKVAIGLLFISQVLGYFMMSPSFSARYLIYWWVAMIATAMVLCAFLSYRSSKARNILERLSDRLKHQGWEFRALLD